MERIKPHRAVPAIKVRQWLTGWEQVSFSKKFHREKPLPHFYVLSLPARELRSLSGISRRQASNLTPRSADLGIQRQLDTERSDEIRRFVEFGFPWSTLSEKKRRTSDFNDLRKPGWLATAIVVNILRKGDQRSGVVISDDDVVRLRDRDDAGSELVLPYHTWSESWHPNTLPPLEVIDGQHRLWAFDFKSGISDFDLPVVAFDGLDISWQAYLFWTINIKPKRINPSLAFDLYPLLRTEDWLEKVEGGHSIYRETRSQELTEAVWSHPESTWYDKVNMLGEKRVRWVTQSAWIKSLMATLVRPWEGRRKKIGGLFGSRLSATGEVLGWSRAQQAAFVIFGWQEFQDAVAKIREPWATDLRRQSKQHPTAFPREEDAAFFGPYTLISTDQGVRGYLHVLNDLCFVAAPKLKLDEWRFDKGAAASDTEAVSSALKSIRKEPIAKTIGQIAEGVSTFDWRTSGTPDLSPEERRAKLVFRGSSGYKEIRALALEHLAEQETDIGKLAKRLIA
jgi:hypothetical protein